MFFDRGLEHAPNCLRVALMKIEDLARYIVGFE
jgi:hypothetical protein